jgi:hypothetical protein
VVAFQTVDGAHDRRHRLGNPGEQQIGLFGVVQPLGKLVNVEKHRPQNVEEIARVIDRPAGNHHAHRLEHGSQRRMLIANDLQAGMGGIHGGLRFFSSRPAGAITAASMPGPAAWRHDASQEIVRTPMPPVANAAATAHCSRH